MVSARLPRAKSGRISQVFANSAAGRKGGEPQSLNVILGPNGLEQQLAEQEAEEREEKEQANRPYWLQATAPTMSISAGFNWQMRTWLLIVPCIPRFFVLQF